MLGALLLLTLIVTLSFVFHFIIIGVLLSFLWVCILPGFFIIDSNEAKTVVLFGKYIGSVTSAGFYWVNPFTVKKKISLRAMNLNGEKLKVKGQLGNPIEIAAVIV